MIALSFVKSNILNLFIFVKKQRMIAHGSIFLHTFYKNQRQISSVAFPQKADSNTEICVQEGDWGVLSGASLRGEGSRAVQTGSWTAVLLPQRPYPPDPSGAWVALQRCPTLSQRCQEFLLLHRPFIGCGLPQGRTLPSVEGSFQKGSQVWAFRSQHLW